MTKLKIPLTTTCPFPTWLWSSLYPLVVLFNWSHTVKQIPKWMAVNKEGGKAFIWFYCQRKFRDLLKGNRIRKQCYSDPNRPFGIIYKPLAYWYSNFKVHLYPSSQSKHPNQEGTAELIHFFMLQLKIASKYLKDFSRNTWSSMTSLQEFHPFIGQAKGVDCCSLSLKTWQEFVTKNSSSIRVTLYFLQTTCLVFILCRCSSFCINSRITDFIFCSELDRIFN